MAQWKSNLFSITWAVVWVETTYPIFSSEVLHTCRAQSSLSSVNNHFLSFCSCHALSSEHMKPCYAKKSSHAPPTGKDEKSNPNFTKVGCCSNILKCLYEFIIHFKKNSQLNAWKYFTKTNICQILLKTSITLFDQQVAQNVFANHN